MRIVNPAIHLRAVGALFYIFDYEHFEEVAMLDRWGDLQFDAARCASVVERDVCSWVRTWLPQALDRLKTTLEFHLRHDPAKLIERAQQDYEFWTENPVDAVWLPLYRGVFDRDEPDVHDRDEYELLETDTLQQADLDAIGFTYDPWRWFDAAVGGGLVGNNLVFEPSAPDWPWLEPIGLASYQRRLAGFREVYLQPFPDAVEGTYSWETYLGLSEEEYQRLDDPYQVLHESRFQRFGFRVSTQGLAALSQALLHAERGQTNWFHDGPALLGQPMYEFANNGLGNLFCTTDRMNEPSGQKHLKISHIDDLLKALRSAGTGLGLDVDHDMTIAIGQAHQRENERPSPFAPYITWATVAELALRARDENMFLYL